MPPLDSAELRAHLVEQLDFLETAAREFDAGKHHFAKPMATSLRTLLHSTPLSHALLDQLGYRSQMEFADTAHAIDPSPEVMQSPGLLTTTIGANGASYLAPLGDREPAWVDFDSYWTLPILKGNANQMWDRAYVVKALANKDGGAHVDPTPSSAYRDLASGLGLPFRVWRSADAVGFGVWSPDDVTDGESVTGAVLQSVRQIAYEVDVSVRRYVDNQGISLTG